MGGKTKIKAKLSPAKAGAWAELGNNAINYGRLSADRWRTHSARTKNIYFICLSKTLGGSYMKTINFLQFTQKFNLQSIFPMRFLDFVQALPAQMGTNEKLAGN